MFSMNCSNHQTKGGTSGGKERPLAMPTANLVEHTSYSSLKKKHSCCTMSLSQVLTQADRRQYQRVGAFQNLGVIGTEYKTRSNYFWCQDVTIATWSSAESARRSAWSHPLEPGHTKTPTVMCSGGRFSTTLQSIWNEKQHNAYTGPEIDSATKRMPETKTQTCNSLHSSHNWLILDVLSSR